MNVKRAFVVTLDVPDVCTSQEVQQYIREAVADYCRCLNPAEDLLFDLDGDSVKVRRAYPARYQKAQGKKSSGNSST